jgi:hypothetical protein
MIYQEKASKARAEAVLILMKEKTGRVKLLAREVERLST